MTDKLFAAPGVRSDAMVDGEPPPRRPWSWRPVFECALTVLAGVLCWVAFALPWTIDRIGPIGILRIPLAVIVLAALAALVPRRWVRVGGVVVGIIIALLVLLKMFNIGFDVAFSRSFQVVGDWYFMGPATDLLVGAVGWTWAVVVFAAIGVFTIGLLIALPWAAARVGIALARHRHRSLATAGALAVVWIVLAASGATLPGGMPIASVSSSKLVGGTIGHAAHAQANHRAFARIIAHDPYSGRPATDLLAALQGKDVLLVFVESYGNVAFTDPTISAIVRPVLTSGAQQLERAGFSARTGLLVSPTFGGASWLAHSTVQSGLWIDSQRRYGQLVKSDRLTLIRAFDEAGWRTVIAIPQMDGDWPVGRRFYGFDRLFTGGELGYRGPDYGYAAMPDQFTLAQFRERILQAEPRKPVMAEIDLLSSHEPWVAPPELIDWDRVGDGSVFNGPDGSQEYPSGSDVPTDVRYARTVAYAMHTLVSFVVTSDNPNLVVIAMGDHQPNSSVTENIDDHRVPAMVIARDPAVIARMADWGWQPGLIPSPDTPAVRMSELRNRIFTDFAADAH